MVDNGVTSHMLGMMDSFPNRKGTRKRRRRNR
jgi:hypothetical protein